MDPSLSGFRTVRFLVDTAAGWAASTRKLKINDFAIVSDDATKFKRGDGTSFNSGSVFSVLPYYKSDAATSNTPFTTYAANATATLTAAQLINKYITSTSAAATALTLPTATLLATALSAVKGTVFEFEIDNSAGANTVTIVAGAGMTTSSDSGPLTVPAGTIGIFKLYFTSTTAAILTRYAYGSSISWYSPIALQQALSGAGAISIATYFTAVTTTGANALTLANATVKGQVKKITLVVDGGDGTLTLTGYTSITFNDAGDYVILQWNGAAWVAIENSGCTIV